MKIMSDWIQQFLSENYVTQIYGLESRIEIKQILLYDYNEPLKENYAYFCDSLCLANMFSVPKKCFFICLGERPLQRFRTEPFSMIWVRDMTITTVFNRVQEYITKLQMWEKTIREIASTTRDVKKIIEASVPVFNNTISIVDETINAKIVTVDCFDENGEYNGFKIEENVFSSPETIAAATPYHTHNRVLKEPHSFKDIHGNDIWACNVLENSVFKGCISLIPSRHVLTSVDKELFQYFTQVLYPILLYKFSDSVRYVDSLHHIYKQILHGEAISEFVYQQIEMFQKKNMKELPAPPNNVICLKLESTDHTQQVPMGYYKDVIKELFPSCVSLPYEHCIVSFISISDPETSISVIAEKISPYLEGSFVKAGISLPFTNIRKARYHYYQAKVALELGITFADQACIYTFREYALCHILLNGTSVLAAQFVCPTGLWEIWDKRKESSVDYWETIKRYLETECNASQTAEKLHIHRQTFLHRIEKLKEWLDMDFDNANDRLWLRCSVKLFELESTIMAY